MGSRWWICSRPMIGLPGAGRRSETALGPDRPSRDAPPGAVAVARSPTSFSSLSPLSPSLHSPHCLASPVMVVSLLLLSFRGVARNSSSSFSSSSPSFCCPPHHHSASCSIRRNYNWQTCLFPRQLPRYSPIPFFPCIPIFGHSRHT